MRIKKGKQKRRRHKKYLKQAKGYSHAKSHHYRTARNQVEKSMQYSTRDRKQKKREMRKLWISRINAACRSRGMSYSKFISGLKKQKINLNRKTLQKIAQIDIQGFDHLVSLSKKNK
ncbi:MAG: 50S ribosomal protein L20 [Elusimicrobiota bacterium]